MPDGSMYASDHEVRLQMEGLDKPRRKRGRPPKMEIKVFKDKIIFENFLNSIKQNFLLQKRIMFS